MTKWEYLHVELTSTEGLPLQGRLDVYGEEGWEMCSVMIVEWKDEKGKFDGANLRWAYRWAVIFKRPKEV